MSDQFFKTFGETQAWLDSIGIIDYTIRDDLTVDVAGDVSISGESLRFIPAQFGAVSGDFNCGGNSLTNLIGSAHTVGGGFFCGHNLLTNLEGSPRECSSFWCCGNQLTSLVGGPETCDSFYCQDNQLTSLDGAPRLCRHVFFCGGNDLTTLNGISTGCLQVNCHKNPQLHDISAAPKRCRVECSHAVVAQNQNKRRALEQLMLLESANSTRDVFKSKKSGRAL